MRWKKRGIIGLAPGVLAVLAAYALPATAQQAGQPRPWQVERQLEEAAEREKALQQRVERLEQRIDELSRQRNTSPTPVPPSAAQPAPRPQASTTPPPASPQSGTRTAAARPGAFDVDEDAAQRALERTLIQSGALLLPRGSISVTPSASYTRVERDNAIIADIVNPATGATATVLANQRLRRNEFTGRLEVRAGMPMDTQLELALPYQHVRSGNVDSFGSESRANGGGFGDLTLGVAKTLTREKGAMPDVIGRLSYNTGTGRRSDGPVGLSYGYRQLNAEVVALKRQDPLAFFAAASYGHSFEEDDIKPGNVTNLSIGAALAASPATSLQLGFVQTYRGKQEVNGVRLAGSDETYGTVTLGASSVLSRDVMLIISTGIGLGNDAPRYSFNVALPITFH